MPKAAFESRSKLNEILGIIDESLSYLNSHKDEAEEATSVLNEINAGKEKMDQAIRQGHLGGSL